MRIVIAVLLLVLAWTVVVGAYVRWDRTERALRENRSLPVDPLPRLIVAGLAIVMVAAAVLVFLAEAGR